MKKLLLLTSFLCTNLLAMHYEYADNDLEQKISFIESYLLGTLTEIVNNNIRFPHYHDPNIIYLFPKNEALRILTEISSKIDKNDDYASYGNAVIDFVTRKNIVDLLLPKISSTKLPTLLKIQIDRMHRFMSQARRVPEKQISRDTRNTEFHPHHRNRKRFIEAFEKNNPTETNALSQQPFGFMPLQPYLACACLARRANLRFGYESTPSEENALKKVHEILKKEAGDTTLKMMDILKSC